MTSIRQVTEYDDFERLLQMMNDTAMKFNPDPTFSGFGCTAKDLKVDYSDPANSQGFVADVNGTIVAFMGVSLSQITKNGHVVFGFLEGNESVLPELVGKCLQIVRENGGEKVFKFAFSKFGQIRNKEITLWEKMGFTSEEYSNVTLMLRLEEWNEPIDFNTADICRASETEIEHIKRLLLEDGENSTADLVHNYKNHVIITLRGEETNEILGLAYYFVDLVNKGTENEFYAAYAFTLHFRPRYDINKEEMRRLLHAAILSTKQLGVQHVYTRITMKNFAVFALMIREGFDDSGMEKNSIVNLYMKV